VVDEGGWPLAKMDCPNYLVLRYPPLVKINHAVMSRHAFAEPFLSAFGVNSTGLSIHIELLFELRNNCHVVLSLGTWPKAGTSGSFGGHHLSCERGHVFQLRLDLKSAGLVVSPILA